MKAVSISVAGKIKELAGLRVKTLVQVAWLFFLAVSHAPAALGETINPAVAGDERSRGFYQLEKQIDFNVLDEVAFNPATKQISLVGHYDARYGGPPIPYLDHLAELLENPSPEFSLNWTPESEPRVASLFNDFNSPEYVRGLVAQWAEIMDSNGRPTGQGRWLLPLVGVKPTHAGTRLGYFGATLEEVSDRLRIVSVESGSPAYNAGLGYGDVIYNYSNLAEFTRTVRHAGEGGTLMLQIQRDGRVGSPIEVVLGGMDGDPWAELDRFDVINKMLWAAGNNNAAMLLNGYGQIQRIMNGSRAGFINAFNMLVAFAGHNDAYWQNVREYQAGRMSQDVVLEHAFRAILSAMEEAFEFADRPLTGAFNNAKWAGRDSGSAFDAAVPVLNDRIQPYLTRVMQSLLSKHDEVQIPPEVFERILGRPVEVAPEYRGLKPDSLLAKLLFDADYLGKSLINMPSLQQAIPAYQSDFAFERNNPDKVGPWHESSHYHLWFSIDGLDFAQSASGHTLRTRAAKVRINIREKAPDQGDLPAVPGGYEELLTALYDDFSRQFPVLHELREAAKLTGVARWLSAKSPDLRLPQAGRAHWAGVSRAPGFIYLTWSPQERPGRLAMALAAMGGARLRLAQGWQPNSDPSVVDLSPDSLRAAREADLALIARLTRLLNTAPAPQPVGWSQSATMDGQTVTTVSFVVPDGMRDAPASLHLRQNASNGTATLWVPDDLDRAEQSLREDLLKAAGPQAKSSLLILLAQVLHEKGHDAAAIETLNQAVGIDPRNPLLNLLIAKEKYDSGDLAGSVESLQQYVAADAKNQPAAQLLAELQARQAQNNPQADPTPSRPSAPGLLAPFTPLLQQAVATLDGSDEAVKASADLKDYHPPKLVLHGLARPVPHPLATTAAWKQLQTQRGELQSQVEDIGKKLDEIRARNQSRGAGIPSAPDETETLLIRKQGELNEQIKQVERKMTEDIIQWNEEHAEPSANTPSTDPTGQKEEP